MLTVFSLDFVVHTWLYWFCDYRLLDGKKYFTVYYGVLTMFLMLARISLFSYDKEDAPWTQLIGSNYVKVWLLPRGYSLATASFYNS